MIHYHDQWRTLTMQTIIADVPTNGSLYHHNDDTDDNESPLPSNVWKDEVIETSHEKIVYPKMAVKLNLKCNKNDNHPLLSVLAIATKGTTKTYYGQCLSSSCLSSIQIGINFMAGTKATTAKRWNNRARKMHTQNPTRCQRF
jgi:hypothetical protein